MSTLKEHLNAKIGNSKQINESLVLSAIVCATCIGYAAGPILNTDFMKSVGSGIGNLLSGIGSLFGFGKKKDDEKKKEEDKKKEDKKNEEEDKIATLKAILKKDPDDMTGKEKEMLEKAANNPRLQKEFSNNELKKLNKAIGVSSSNDDDESMPEGDEKKLHDILKKKPEDMTPKDKNMLKSFNNKYDLSDYLSKGELDKMSAAGISAGTNNNDEEKFDDDEVEGYIKTGEWNAILLKIAAKANEEEKDPEKKKKMDAMLDIAIASTYDENGNVLPLEEQRKKMKENIGEENWEAFSKDLDTYVNEADKADLEKFTKDVKSSYFGLSEEERDKIDENQKKRAKEASERIAKEKDEQKKLDDEIADLQKQIEEKSKDSVMKDDANPEIKELNKKIKEAQDKKADLVNNSTLGTATPSVAKNINDRDKENNGIDITAKPDKDDKTESEPKKDDTGNDDEPKKDNKKDGEGEKDNTGNGDKSKEPKKEETEKEGEKEPKKDDKTESEPKKDDKKDNSDPIDKLLDDMGLSKEEKEVEKEYLKKSGDALGEKMKRDSEAFSEKFSKDQEISNEQFAKIGDANKEWFNKSQELKLGSDEYNKALKEHNDKINDINKEAADKRKQVNDEYTKKLEASDKQHKDVMKSLDDEKQANLDKIKKPSDDKTVKDAESEVNKKIDDIESKYEKEFEKVTQDFSKKEKELNDEYEKKIKDAKSEDDVNKLKDELKKKQDENINNWEKEGKRLNAEKHKEMDNTDDTDEHDTEKDATKKGKYKVKEEEVTDPETGKKIKVTTYTGPRGGKFYYPDGKPKKPENKVYVHESMPNKFTPFNRLRRYLLEQLNLK